MSDISAASVKQLRDRTDMPFKECKKALVEADGDMEKAVDILRAKNKNVADKKADRVTAEGRIAVHFDPEQKVGSIVEVQCESAPTANNENFGKLADSLAKHIAYNTASTVEEVLKQPFHENKDQTVEDRINEVIGLIRENMKIFRFERFEGLSGGYSHHNGSVGAAILVQGDSDADGVLRDVAMHITATAPIAGTREEFPAEVLEKEKQIAIDQTREDPKMAGKPDEIIEKSVMGKLNKWLAQNCLLDQPFVKDESVKVGDLLKKNDLKYVKFLRYRVGELNPPVEEETEG